MSIGPKAERERTLRRMVGDLLGRAFEGSAHELVAHLLDQTKPSAAELDEIRRTIAEYQTAARASRDMSPVELLAHPLSPGR